MLVLCSFVSAFERVKIDDTFIVLDNNLPKKEIIEYVSDYDLSRINSIYFLNIVNPVNDGWYHWFGYWSQIFIYNMQRENRDWKSDFYHEHAHHIGHTQYNNDMSEKFAYYYCFDKEYFGDY